ncbi:hypothetical protein K402DRAFT_421636 [Aulographum hederae CBS 113979]|uniref:Aminoglycoside phosphotransferase domain-containing protein n=1 Tax=Aulographum hederae CBS 113979 TaxID=1176131 RepID=A0A6G1GZ57_9PEZI|nr:hypothetical protein K402DRAFT_421636 [Aulographum hederae CBS 113979]
MHDDLCEMNILVDPTDSHITGIIDWADAKVLPFGLALWGVVNALGWMDSEGWRWYGNYEDLEDLFWTSFRGAVGDMSEQEMVSIRVASTLGFFLRYGFAWDDGVRRRPVKEENYSMRYLDAFFGAARAGIGSFLLD